MIWILTLAIVAQTKPSIPPKGECMVFIGAAWSGEMDAYRRITGDTPYGTKFFYDAKDTNCTFFWQCARNNCPKGGALLIEYGLGQTTAGDLKPFLRGEYDDSIINLGNAIKEWGGPVYMVIGYEFDHPDTSWSNRYTAQEYIQVYRRVVDLWRLRDVKNVAYVWHTGNESPSVVWKNFQRRDLQRPADFWPGDDYVDWVAASLYWDDQARHLPVVASFARRKGKPLMIAECSYASESGAVPRSFEQWHGPFLRLCERYGVKAIGYNNFIDEPLCAPPFRRSGFQYLNDDVVRGWSREMKKARYYHAGVDKAGTYR